MGGVTAGALDAAWFGKSKRTDLKIGHYKSKKN